MSLGKLPFFVGDEPRQMSAGSWLYIEGGAMHALESDNKAVMLVAILFNKTKS